MKTICIALVLIAVAATTVAQESKSIWEDMELTGYIKYMNTNTFTRIDSTWLIDNLIHHRFNYKWYLSEHTTLEIGNRNRLFYGDAVRQTPNYDELIAVDTGKLHFLTNNIGQADSYILNTTFDRAFISYTQQKTTLSIGRQRINWGQTFVWNPNDIFNSYSFFDFDYEERAGSDAIRLQYYPDYTSVLDMAVKIDRDDRITAAALYRFNRWGYDIQYIAGITDTTDYIIGAGWSGNIGKVGFNGECTYFHPQDAVWKTTGDLIASMGMNYTFKKPLTITLEGNYNSYYDAITSSDIANLYAVPLSVKTITFSKFSWFAQAAYAINPLLSVNLAGIYLPSLDHGYYLMPSLQYTLKEAIEVSLLSQRFEFTFNTQHSKLNLLFLRLRYSF